ncbi:MAG: hypothetical protein ACI9K5_003309, partial [Gammaproteobacteria bacterium]
MAILPILALVFALPAGLPSSSPSSPLTDDLDFERDVRPLLAARCFPCHGPEKQKSSLRLDRRAAALRGGDSGEAAIVPGDSAASLIIALISEDDPELAMPPEGKLLEAGEIEILRNWINQGADWGAAAVEIDGADHWSLQPIVRPELPEATHPEWGQPIDRFVLAGLEAAGLQPAPLAERATLLRRMSLVLCGLPPAPEEVEAFAGSAGDEAYGELLERLLASENYGERWARHWLDVARFAETTGFETNTPRPTAWRYRDYIVRAFNDDMPYDRFLTEQIAGDAFGVDAATGFLVGGAYDTVKSPDVGLTLQQRQDELADIINTTSTAFMGLTVACARCHDHKFDPIAQSDYYSMQAIFAGVQHGERPLRPADHAERAVRLEDDMLELAALRAELDALPDASQVSAGPPALVIDDQDVGRVNLLRERTDSGTNPAGIARGQLDDRGDMQRLPNISGGSHSRWSAARDEDLISYRPDVQGHYRLWLSWGVGGNSHTSAATYWLDADGDLATTADRKLLATVDQRAFAGGTAEPGVELHWSGLHDAGTQELTHASLIVLHAGSSSGPETEAVTADVIVLQAASEPARSLPDLRPGVSAKINREDLTPILTSKLRFQSYRTNSAHEPCLDELEVYANEANVALDATHSTSGNYVGNAKHQQLHLNDGLYGNDHSWIANTPGTGWVELAFAAPALIDTVLWGRDRTAAYSDRLATDYSIEVTDDSGAWHVVATSRNRLPAGMSRRAAPAYRFAGLAPEIAGRAAQLLDRIGELERAIARSQALPRVYAGIFQQPALTHRLYRGDPLAEREVVAPDVPGIFASLELDAD